MSTQQLSRAVVKVTGQVQGVGFRPFVYRLATELGLAGFVLNDASGVTIEAQSEQTRLDEFVRRLGTELPPLASITDLRRQPAEVVVGEQGFRIRPSSGGELTDAQVTVDTAVCAQCLGEMKDPVDRRYRYPFINCTNCGPRYTIVKRIPYDRANTTMADFAMCPQCAAEYTDPASRRFHAQPIACPRCGPSVWLVDRLGRQIVCEDPIATAAGMLCGGAILAIKGLGGFHLACVADDDHAVRRLRLRKRREAKPFAVMVADLAAAAELVELDEPAMRLLASPVNPIVLLPRRPLAPVAPSVAEGLDCLAVMLPYTPLHHLLYDCGLGPLVMTSGNVSDEPLVKDNEDAVSHLGRIADALLLHNRPIQRRLDDSVVQYRRGGRYCIVRRSRGYAPQPVYLKAVDSSSPPVLAVGAELKNAVCLLAGGRAVLGEHVGDLKDGRTYRHFIETVSHLEALFDVVPQVIAADLHPQYLSSQYAHRRHMGELAGRAPLPIVRVQHHHAHIASCLAEHGRSGPVIGLACDGAGLGDDGTVWGCEVLQADLADHRRLGHLRHLPLPGGDAAAIETYRPALAALYDTYGSRCVEVAKQLGLAGGETVLDAAAEMLSLGVNCPPASSLGRWFDAVAAFTDIALANDFEGQAAMLLEAAIRPGVEDAYEFEISSAGPFVIDLRPMVRGIVADLASTADPAVIAAKFHNTVAAFLLAAAVRAREETGLETVALSGGCFANRYLTARLQRLLEAEGFEVLVHRIVPCNDGGIALGQAAIAATVSAAERDSDGQRRVRQRGRDGRDWL